MAVKEKIRIRLKGYDHQLVDCLLYTSAIPRKDSASMDDEERLTGNTTAQYCIFLTKYYDLSTSSLEIIRCVVRFMAGRRAAAE